MSISFSNIVFAVAVFSVLPLTPAFAYLDGATSSMILQAATGAFASGLVFGKIYWTKIKGFFKRSKTISKD